MQTGGWRQPFLNLSFSFNYMMQFCDREVLPLGTFLIKTFEDYFSVCTLFEELPSPCVLSYASLRFGCPLPFSQHALGTK